MFTFPENENLKTVKFLREELRKTDAGIKDIVTIESEGKLFEVEKHLVFPLKNKKGLAQLSPKAVLTELS